MEECQSEVARIRKQIELECQALHLALYGYATVTSHKIINHRYDNLGRYQDELSTLVGKEKALEVVVQTYNEVLG